MGFLDSFLLAGLFFVGIPLAWGIGWVLEKVTGIGFLGRLPILLVIVGTFFGIPLALRFAGVHTVGRVTEHSERVDLARIDRSWTTTQWLGVRFPAAGAKRADPTTRRDPGSDSITLQLRATAAMYDRIPVGASVPITYVSFRPSIARLSERTTGDLWREVQEIEGATSMIVVFGAIVLAVMIARWHPTVGVLRRVRTLAFVALAVTAALGGRKLVYGSNVHGSNDPMPANGKATVEGISSVSEGRCLLCRRNELARLDQPYEVVTLAFTPAGAKWPVRTADAIDSGSVRGLREGATLAVRYAPATPRHARIEGAQRTFEQRNGRDAFRESALLVAAAVIVFLLFARLTGRLSHRPAAA